MNLMNTTKHKQQMLRMIVVYDLAASNTYIRIEKIIFNCLQLFS